MACNFQTVVKFGEMLQDQLVSSLDPQLYAQVHPWLEDILAAHFVQQRDEVCPADSQPRAPVTSNGRQASSHDEPLWIQDAHGGYEGPDRQAIPRLASFGRTYYVLYAYSGHRRQGDILEWMEHFQTQFGVTVQVLTIDIVYDAELCDLQSERAKGLWLNLVKRGYFMGLIGAPPCETWSIARFRSLLDENDHGHSFEVVYHTMGSRVEFLAGTVSGAMCQRLAAGLVHVYGLCHTSWDCLLDGTSRQVNTSSVGALGLETARAAMDFESAGCV